MRIRDARYLQTFLSTRKLHNPLKAFQLAYAERVARVKEVGFYHGSDELYILHGIPGVWHEECLDLNANDDLASRH